MLRSDDAARRLKFPYLGPPGWRLWFDFTVPEWIVWASVSAVAAAGGWWFFDLLSGGIPIAKFLGAVVCLVLAHRLVARGIARFDFNRPLRRVPRVVIAELTAPRPDNPRREYVVVPDPKSLIDRKEQHG